MGNAVQPGFKLGKVPELDGLRGVAIIGVMLFHGSAPVLKGAFIGVDIFFVLSGFLITSLLVSEFNSTGAINLHNFYIRRALRLGPALLALLTIFCFVSFVVLSEEKASKNYIEALISLVYISNWARAFGVNPPDFLGHTWSLSIEEQFYIIWPVLLAVLLRTTKKMSHIIVVATILALLSWAVRIQLSINGAPLTRLINGLDTRADALMVGSILGVMLSSGMVSENINTLLHRCLVIAAPIAIASLLFFAIFSDWRNPWFRYWGLLAVDLLTMILIFDIVINPKSTIKKLFAARWLVWVGTISYGLYLWHFPIYKTIFALGFRSSPILLTFGVFITFVFATLSYYLMERPIMKLKKSFVSTQPKI